VQTGARSLALSTRLLCRHRADSDLLQLVEVDDANLARERQRVSVALLLRYPVNPMIVTVIGTKVAVLFISSAVYKGKMRSARRFANRLQTREPIYQATAFPWPA
jgi:hypothetical protein